jgi:hypothetical protein
MNKTFLFLALASLLFACKDPGVNTQDPKTTDSTTSSEKSPEEIADSTVRAIKRNFEASSPAASFDSFRKAVLIGDGSTVAEMAGEKTLEYYANIHKKVLSAGKSEIQAMPVGEHQMVLMSRLLLQDRGLKDMDAKTYLKNLVETGSLDKVAVGLIKPADIQTNGSTASAPALIFENPANLSINFVQSDNGEWKVNMGDVIQKAAAIYDERFKAMGQNANTHVANTVGAFAQGGAFNQSLYNPLN